MKKTARINRSGQRGTAIIELALILPLLVTLLAMAVLFGRVFFHYTVAQKAAHDAARYMSTNSLRNMTSGRIDDSLRVAQQILDAELAELNPGSAPLDTIIRCGTFDSCNGLSVPDIVSVGVQMRMEDPILSVLTQLVLGETGILITANVTMHYVGQ